MFKEPPEPSPDQPEHEASGANPVHDGSVSKSDKAKETKAFGQSASMMGHGVEEALSMSTGTEAPAAAGGDAPLTRRLSDLLSEEAILAPLLPRCLPLIRARSAPAGALDRAPPVIIPRARPNRPTWIERPHPWPMSLPVPLVQVHASASEASEQAGEDQACEDAAPREGHGVEDALSVSLSAAERAAWLAEVRHLNEPDSRERYSGEARTYDRIKADVSRGDCVMAEKWRRSFKAFLLDVGPKPTPSHTLDRINPLDPVYGPGKCRWLSPEGQANNRTTNVRFTATWRGEVRTLTMAEWARVTGQPYNNLAKRYQRSKDGMPHYRIIGYGAEPTPSDVEVVPTVVLPPGWDRCPETFKAICAEQGAVFPPKQWVMHHLLFQRHAPKERRQFASVPVFFAWAARERVLIAENNLLNDLDVRRLDDPVPVDITESPNWMGYAQSRSILLESEAMIANTPGEWRFYQSLYVHPERLSYRYTVPIRDCMNPVRVNMKWGKAVPKVEGG